MNARAAPVFGAVLGLALVGAGRSHALSLRSSAAESFLGDASPGTAVVFSRATGGRLRVENSGAESATVEFKLVPPPPGGCADGYEPWPDPKTVRLDAKGATTVDPGKAAEAELVVTVPKSMAPDGGRYEIDVVATGRDRAGASLSLKTRALLSVGARLASAGDAPAGGWSDLPGFEMSPPKSGGGRATLKLANAGDDALTVSLTPAWDWDDDARIPAGYEPAPNPRWLRLEPGVVEVRAGAIGSARIEAVVPKEPRYAGRKFAFVVAVDARAGKKAARRWFVLTVDTSRWEEEHQRPR